MIDIKQKESVLISPFVVIISNFIIYEQLKYLEAQCINSVMQIFSYLDINQHSVKVLI